MVHFADRLADAIDRTACPACVGLDPVLDRLPAHFDAPAPASSPAAGPASAGPAPVNHEAAAAAAIERFCLGVLDACAGLLPAVKVQSACFERFGGAGFAALRSVLHAARQRGYLTILDAKRGDIGVTADHYAAAAFDTFDADAVTLSGYLGPDTLEPFVRRAAAPAQGARGRGVFVLVRTSNPGSDAIQSALLADGRSVAELMADAVAQLGASRRGVRGLSGVGAVVAATKPQDGPALRARMPDAVFLVPGYGAQGGSAADVRGMLRPGRSGPGDAGVLVTASRSVIYPPEAPGAGAAWPSRVRGAAEELARQMREVIS